MGGSQKLPGLGWWRACPAENLERKQPGASGFPTAQQGRQAARLAGVRCGKGGRQSEQIRPGASDETGRPFHAPVGEQSPEKQAGDSSRPCLPPSTPPI